MAKRFDAWMPPAEAAEEPTTEAVGEVKTNATHAHIHEWTQISPRKRKCKPCGKIERPGDAS